ncbi:hypothetical protein SLEP1_g22713 [Rubroshorea leprosula]|uniref:Uncharacterized protein n=1 Tax=Rubroshorea leprosula TaxID=152421 RepID=A0AAV5JA09_9ROSI|nr:hypothetical protein SLEP1_g22713 [Rubroshorea leprosula]
MEDMSSKETLSVGGSEEVRAMEHEEMGLETESFGSERTEEEMGKEEMGDEGIPLNILKVEGRQNKCYEDSTNIVSRVKEYEAEWNSRDSLVHLVETYNIPPRVLVRPVGAREKAWKRRVEEQEEEKRDEVVEFVPRPPLVELDLELNKSKSIATRFIYAIFPKVDQHQAKDEMLTHGGVGVVHHVLEATNLVNALSNEFFESLKGRNNLKKENEELKRRKKERDKDVEELTLEVERLQEENDNLKKVKKAATELEKSVNLRVLNVMENHIAKFLKSSMFDNIVNLYQLPTTILAFTAYRKKVKAQHPELDVIGITFGEQEGGVEENGESMTVDFHPEVKLKWDHDNEGRTIFPFNFNFKFIAVEEKEPEIGGIEVGENQSEQKVN